jgi:hypothetical protein
MPSKTKRPSKAAKAARKAVAESKLLTAKAERDSQTDDAFKQSVVSPRVNTTAMKPRPDKKRG